MKRSLSASVPSFHSRFTRRRLARFGQDEADARAVRVAVFRLDGDASAVCRDDVAHEREREGGGVRLARATLEERVDALLRDAGTVVLHRDGELAFGLVVMDVHDDAAAGVAFGFFAETH